MSPNWVVENWWRLQLRQLRTVVARRKYEEGWRRPAVRATQWAIVFDILWMVLWIGCWILDLRAQRQRLIDAMRSLKRYFCPGSGNSLTSRVSEVNAWAGWELNIATTWSELTLSKKWIGWRIGSIIFESTSKHCFRFSRFLPSPHLFFKTAKFQTRYLFPFSSPRKPELLSRKHRRLIMITPRDSSRKWYIGSPSKEPPCTSSEAGFWHSYVELERLN